jgi:DNA-binding response OmpR family regulator
LAGQQKASLLQKEGFTVVVAADATEALIRMQNEPILIVTGLEIASQEWALSLGAAGVVKKPFDMTKLFAEIRRWCGLPLV